MTKGIAKKDGKPKPTPLTRSRKTLKNLNRLVKPTRAFRLRRLGLKKINSQRKCSSKNKRNNSLFKM